MLELGKTPRQKWTIIGVLAVLHVLAIAGVVTIFVVERSTDLSPLAAILLIIGTVTWLFSFVLLFVNIAYIYLKRD